MQMAAPGGKEMSRVNARIITMIRAGACSDGWTRVVHPFFGTLRVIQCVHFFRSRALRPQRVLVTALSKHAPKLKGLIYRKENGSLMV